MTRRLLGSLVIALVVALVGQIQVYEDGSYTAGPAAGCIPAQACDIDDSIVWQQSLDAWSDPTDYTEALYVHAPDGACAVELRDAVIKITLCEI